MSASVSCFGSGRNRGRNGCGIYNYLFLGAAEISANLPPIAGSRRDSPQTSRRLQEAGGIFRKPPAGCRKSERFSANLPQAAGSRRDFPQASRQLQEVGEIFRKPPDDCRRSEGFSANLPQAAGSRRDFPQTSRRLQEVREIFRKPPDDCRRSERFSANLPQVAGSQRRFPPELFICCKNVSSMWKPRKLTFLPHYILRSFCLIKKNQKIKAYTPAATNGSVPLKSRKLALRAQTAEISLRSTPPFASRRFR